MGKVSTMSMTLQLDAFAALLVVVLATREEMVKSLARRSKPTMRRSIYVITAVEISGASAAKLARRGMCGR